MASPLDNPAVQNIIAQGLGEAIKALIDRIFHHASNPEPQAPVSTQPQPAPQPAAPPTVEPPHPPVTAVPPGNVVTLGVQLEGAWHDWFKTEEHPDGLITDDKLNPIKDGTAGFPPAPVIRFQAGDGKVYNPGDPRPFPITWHFSYSNGLEYQFSSNETNPNAIPELGHIQMGGHWQESQGYDCTVRLSAFGGGARWLSVFVTDELNHVSNVVRVSVGGR